MKRQNYWKHICAFLLALCMTVAMPLSVSADAPLTTAMLRLRFPLNAGRI